jgi:hypothetical protein
MIFLSSFFLQIVPHSLAYIAVSTNDDLGYRDSNPLKRSKSAAGRITPEPGTQEDASIGWPQDQSSGDADTETPLVPNADTEETSPLTTGSSVPGGTRYEETRNDTDAHHSHRLDIRGVGMLRMLEFYHLFVLLGLLCGIGLMTIK